MLLTILYALGGLGLFLLGMIVMSEGLKRLAGDAMRTWLMRFTRSPLSGAMTGATTTALLQSSSATTVAAVGFVGAGLLGFPEALGVIFGANIGTTLTGWIVALLGFKLQLSTVVLPLILVGAILRLFSTGRWSHFGYALAGFGLIFVGITWMQQGMSGWQGEFDFSQWQGDSLGLRFKLLLVGIVFTIITQSSSAGVAATLTALFTGLIQFEQAAALVIGMDIGTTMTAFMATIGGTVGARRTGYSHVIYNVFTGIGAFLLITPYIFLWEYFAPGSLKENAEVGLVAFHTLFNTLGIVVVLPLTKPFARLMEKLVPGEVPAYLEKLYPELAEQTSVALTAVLPSVLEEFEALLRHSAALLGHNEGKKTRLDKLQSALNTTHGFLGKIRPRAEEGAELERLLALIHMLDHMQRLHERCEEDEERAVTARKAELVTEQREILMNGLMEVAHHIGSERWFNAEKSAGQVAAGIQAKVDDLRQQVVTRMGKGELSIDEGTDYLEAIRWLERVSNHVYRICHHFGESVVAVAK